MENIPTSPEEREIIESPEAIKIELESLAESHQLLAHQTRQHFAEKILSSETFENGGFLNGTCVLTRPEPLLEISEEMSHITEHPKQLIHRNSDSVVILALPNDIVEMVKEQNRNGKIDVPAIDDFLIEKAEKGEIPEMGLPNRFVYGYLYDQKLVKNPRFNPVF